LKAGNENVLYRMIGYSALSVMLATLLSGFVGVALSALHPQPAWEGADVFIRNYHPVQNIPFVFGILLALSSGFFIASAGRLASDEKEKICASLAGILAAVYIAVVTLNYAVQMAYIPAAIRYDKDAIPILTMVNPASLAWGIEMFGYAFQGISMSLLAPLFRRGTRALVIRWLLVLNGVLSVAGAVITCADITWCMKPLGLASGIIWNLLFMAIMLLIFIDAKQKRGKNITGG
jgi:hypothetical protein